MQDFCAYNVYILVPSNILELSHVMRNVFCHLQVLPNFSATVQPMFYVESWSHFPKERDRLLKLIKDTNVIYAIKFYRQTNH